MTGPVTIEVVDGVALIRLDRPPANAFDEMMGRALVDAVREAGERDDVGALVLWGGPRDLRRWGGSADPGGGGPRARAAPGGCARRGVRSARGAGEDLDRGDQRLRARRRPRGRDRLRPPHRRGRREARAAGGTPGGHPRGRRDPAARPLGRRRADPRPRYTGRVVDAEEALRIGLVETVVPAAEVREAALAAAAALAAGPRQALAAAKEAIRAAVRTPGPQGIAAERALFLGLFGTADQREGMAAFLEKRDPVFGVCIVVIEPSPPCHTRAGTYGGRRPVRPRLGMNRPRASFEGPARAGPLPAGPDPRKGSERHGR